MREVKASGVGRQASGVGRQASGVRRQATNNAATNNTSGASNNNTTNTNNEPNNDPSCNTVYAEYDAAAVALPRDCAVAADCQLIHWGGCVSAVRTDADLTEFEAAADAALAACGVLIPNNYVCPQAAPQMMAACHEGTCTAAPACDQIGELLSEYRSCSAPEDCELRTDVNECGCPVALNTGMELPAVELTLAVCDYAEMCALVDCAVGNAATCTDGTCVLTQ